MSNYTDLKEQVEFGLDSIDADRTIEIPLRDLMYSYQIIGLLINFFHQPLHYPTLESVNEFMGVDGEDGAYRLLQEIYYKRFYDIWPEDIRHGFAEGRYDNPNPPYYYKPSS